MQTPKRFSEVGEQFVHWFAGALLLLSGWLLLDTAARRGYYGFAPILALLIVALGTRLTSFGHPRTCVSRGRISSPFLAFEQGSAERHSP